MADSGESGVIASDAETRRRTKPSGGRLDSTTGGDGAPIRYGFWQPQGEKTGTCLILQGRREFIEKYFETIRDLLDRGYAVYTFDWRGQGRSVRLLSNPQKGHIRRFEDYLSDLARFHQRVIAKDTSEPITVLGHSMGAHLALRYAHDHPNAVARLLLTAPMIAINFARAPEWAIRAVVNNAGRLGLGRRYAPFQHDFDERCRQFDGNVLTSDPDRFADEAYFVDRDPQLAMGGVTYGWLRAALKSIEVLNAPGYPEAISTPTFIAAAGGDKVVDNARLRRFADRLPRGQSVTIGDAQHEILRETESIRAMFWRLADEFLAATG